MATVEKMKLLYNNYEQDTSINEYVTPNEKKEENDFVEAVLAAPVMRFELVDCQFGHSFTIHIDRQTCDELSAAKGSRDGRSSHAQGAAQDGLVRNVLAWWRQDFQLWL